MRKKLIILLSLTFALNSYSLASASEIINSTSFGSAVKAQSAVLDVSFGIFLPLKLVGTVLNEEHLPLSDTPTNQQGDKDNGRSASAADFALLPAREDIKSTYHFVGNCTDFLCATCPVSVSTLVYLCVLLQGTGQGAWVFLLLLMYIICLSLSNLPLPVFDHAYIWRRARLQYILQPGFYFIRYTTRLRSFRIHLRRKLCVLKRSLPA